MNAAVRHLRIFLVAVGLSGMLGGAGAADPAVVRAQQEDDPRLLLPFDLTPENFELSVPGVDRDTAGGQAGGWAFREGGQFDVLIKREHFPLQVPASCCNHYLILTMPYTNPRLEGGDTKIAAKRSLFEQIEKLKAAKSGKLRVIIDVTWYAVIEKEEPLSVSLKDRQIYFRHWNGGYLGTTEAVAERP
jgi:hypothetical protein